MGAEDKTTDVENIETVILQPKTQTVILQSETQTLIPQRKIQTHSTSKTSDSHSTAENKKCRWKINKKYPARNKFTCLSWKTGLT